MKNKYIYPAIFIPEELGFSVLFPDLPGCHTQGDSLEDALDMAKDALSIYIFDLEEDNKQIPLPSNPAEIKPDTGFVSLIEFNMLQYRKRYDKKAVKKTLTIPHWLNVIAEEANVNFSNILQNALKRELNL